MLTGFIELIKAQGIPVKGIIHIGMHTAEEYPYYIEHGISDDNILFIEANPNMVDKHSPEKCSVLNAAISDKEEIVKFNITNNNASSSILKLKEHSDVYPHIIQTQTLEMKTTTLDKVFKQRFKIEDYNILNLDIQGAELKAMRGLSNWSNIDAVYSEVNYRELYEGCALVGEIDEFLRTLGFVKIEEVDTGCGWGDALYVKKS